MAVVGNSGSGKSTLGATLGDRLGVPYIELDSVVHYRPDWEDLPTEALQARVGEIVATDGWVIDGNYGRVRDLIWARADTVVWLDLPRAVIMRQLAGRTFSRLVRRTELWGGNREAWRDQLSRDPTRSILLWAWTQHETYRQRYRAAMADPDNNHLSFVTLRSRAEVRAFVDGCRAE